MEHFGKLFNLCSLWVIKNKEMGFHYLRDFSHVSVIETGARAVKEQNEGVVFTVYIGEIDSK